MKVKTPVCHCCHQRCGLRAYVEDGKVIKMAGNPEHPISQGNICPKGLAAPEALYHPSRLNYPIKRIGIEVKGNGRGQNGIKLWMKLLVNSKK
jgi:anaerobic selenocysteine-containing dehydrogenase